MRTTTGWLTAVVLISLILGPGCGVTRHNLRTAKPAPSIELFEGWMEDKELYFERSRIDEKAQYVLWRLPFSSDLEQVESWDMYVEFEETFITYVIWLGPVTQAMQGREDQLNLALFAAVGRMNFTWNQVKVGLDEDFEAAISLEFPSALIDRDEFIGNLYYCIDKADEFTQMFFELMDDPGMYQQFDGGPTGPPATDSPVIPL
jgi:hypothetical protein